MRFHYPFFLIFNKKIYFNKILKLFINKLSNKSSFFLKISSSRTLSILSYCIMSILMTIINKYVITKYGFNFDFFILIIQICNILKIIALPKLNLFIVRKLSFKSCQGLPTSLLLIITKRQSSYFMQ
ncbi:hypothetical protein PCK1_001656 [Pneumocystis canis]|nr:hypothetical protein PCK1_001656 [Pneumocystis canis]